MLCLLLWIPVITNSQSLDDLNQCRLEFLNDSNNLKNKPKNIADLNSTQYYSVDFSREEAATLNIPIIGGFDENDFVHVFRYYEGRSKNQIIRCKIDEEEKLHEFKWFVGLDITSAIKFESKKCYIRHDHKISTLKGLMGELNNSKSHIQITFNISSVGASGNNLVSVTSDIREYLSGNNEKKYGALLGLIKQYENQLSHSATTIDPHLQIIYHHNPNLAHGG